MAERTANEEIHDAMLRRQIYLEKYTNGAQRTIMGVLDSTEEDLRTVLERRLSKLITADGGASAMSRDTAAVLNTLATQVADLRHDAIDKSFDDLTDELRSLGPHEAEYVDKTFNKYSPVSLDTVMPSAGQLAAIILSEPMQGKLLSQWADKLKDLDVSRIMDTVRAGMAQGETTDKIVRSVLGTDILNGADGITEVTRRNAAAITQTAIATTASEARAAYTEANSDIVGDEVWVATLDAFTCEECAALDGEHFQPGEGEQPPVHYNCRCVRVPTLDGTLIGDRPATSATEDALDGLSEEDRAAAVEEMTGPVPASMTYQDWLSIQTPEFQDEVLGPNRAQMFRDGEVKLSQFVNRDGDLLTLDELKERSGGSTVADMERPGVKAFGADPAEAMANDWIAQSNITSVDELVMRSVANDDILKALGTSIADDTGVAFKKGPIKTRARIEEKVARGKLPGQVTDVVRASFYTDSPDEVEAVINGLAKELPIVDENWRLTEAGYFDRTVKVRFPNGMIGEVQVGPPQLFAAKKDGGHALYTQWQAAKRDFGAASKEATGFKDAMIELYGKARASLPDEWQALLDKELKMKP